MIRYYEAIYNQCCKNLKKNIEENSEKNPVKKIRKTLNNFENSINPRPMPLKIIFWSFIISAFLLLILMLYYTSSDFFHSNFSDRLFFVFFVIFVSLMTVLAILLCLLDNNWHYKTLKGELKNYVLYCRKLHKEIEKYHITKIDHYKNFIEEISKKKTEWVKIKGKINAVVYGYTSIIFYFAKLFIEAYFIQDKPSATLSNLSLILVFIILFFVILLGIKSPISSFCYNKITYYEDFERNIQIIIDDMKGYYSDIKSDVT